MTPPGAEITLIGNDPSLAYLIGRFAEQSGHRLSVFIGIPVVEEIWIRKPCLVLFCSMDSLESAQSLVVSLANREITVGVCASLSDEAHAHELGAEHCLVHPLTYDAFTTILLANDHPARISGTKQDEP